MTDMIVINGVGVSMDEPCAIVRELRKAEITVAVGGAVVRTRFGDDEAQWGTANLDGLRDLIAHYERLCPETSARVRRRARRMRFA